MVKIVYKLLRMLEDTKYYCPVLSRIMGSNLEKIDEDKIKDFLSWFLKQEYNIKDKMLLFHFLEVAKEKVEISTLEEMAVDSRYFETMPERIIIDYFTNRRSNFLSRSSIFKTYLTSKINRNITLLRLIGMNAYIDYDYAYRRLASEDDVETLIDYANYKGVRGNDKYALAVADNLNLSLDDIKKFFQKTDTYSYTMAESFAIVYLRSKNEEKDAVITSLIEISEYPKVDDDRDYLERKNGKITEKYQDVLYGISESKIWTDEMKSCMAKKLLAMKNLEYIYYWFIFEIECSFNYQLIDAVLEESEYAIVDLLISLNDNYFQYAIMKVFDKGKDYLRSLVQVMALDMSLEDINGVDRILDFLYYVDYEYQISQEAAFNLLLAGSIYAPKYLSEYHWSNSEREQILKVYGVMHPIYLKCFKEYLSTGNPLKLPDKNEALRTLKKTFEN